jgi:DNA-binding LacI/PurR family transcriptional regulator
MPQASVIDATASDGAPVARYYALYSVLKEGIRGGVYQPGMRLPTVTELVDRYKVSRTTVARALGELERAGLVESRWGAGTFVTPEAIPTIELLIAGNRPSPGRVRAVFFDHLLDAVRESFGGAGCRVTMSYTLEHAPSAEEILAVAQARRAESIVAYRPDAALRAELARVAERLPVVSLFREAPGTRVDAALFDPREAVESVVATLAASGRRLMVYAACRMFHEEPEPSPYAQIRSAFMDATARVGVAVETVSFETPDATAPEDRAAAERLQALPAGAVVFADALGRLDYPGVKFQFTESPETCAALHGRGVNVFYMDSHRACRAAAELAVRRREAGGDAPGRVARVAPEFVPAEGCFVG